MTDRIRGTLADERRDIVEELVRRNEPLEQLRNEVADARVSNASARRDVTTAHETGEDLPAARKRAVAAEQKLARLQRELNDLEAANQDHQQTLTRRKNRLERELRTTADPAIAETREYLMEQRRQLTQDTVCRRIPLAGGTRYSLETDGASRQTRREAIDEALRHLDELECSATPENLGEVLTSLEQSLPTVKVLRTTHENKRRLALH